MPPPRRPERPPATLSDIRDQTEKLCREIGTLHAEVFRLTNLIAEARKGERPEKITWNTLDYSRGERPSTPEPLRRIWEALNFLQTADTLENQFIILKAIAKDLDGAMVDIRAARMNIEAIVGNADMRDRFRGRKR